MLHFIKPAALQSNHDVISPRLDPRYNKFLFDIVDKIKKKTWLCPEGQYFKPLFILLEDPLHDVMVRTVYPKTQKSTNWDVYSGSLVERETGEK